MTAPLANNVLNALRSGHLLPGAVEAPAWVDGGSGPPPGELVAFPNGLLHLPAFDRGDAGHLLPPTVGFFTPTALRFPFDPAAPEPAA